jgi:hypothetical protein
MINSIKVYQMGTTKRSMEVLGVKKGKDKGENYEPLVRRLYTKGWRGPQIIQPKNTLEIVTMNARNGTTPQDEGGKDNALHLHRHVHRAVRVI